MNLDPVETLKEYLSYASISTEPSYKPQILAAADFIENLLKQIGLTPERVETAGNPIILGKRQGLQEWPHVLIYGHYDVQPVDPLEEWHTDPFKPVIKGDRIYARGAADNKAQLLTHIFAVKKILEEDPNIPLRITIIVEGEEEIGSSNFPKFISENKEQLKADLLYMSDTASLSLEQVVITTGLRGIVGFDIELQGPKVDLHSGVHGGAVLNPILALMQLGSSLYDKDGFVNIPGFYDDVLPPQTWEREELKHISISLEDYKQLVGVPEFFKLQGYTPFEAIRFWPAIEFNGIKGGYQGDGTKTVLPSKALAKVTIRLVPNQDPKKIQKLVIAELRKRCPQGVTMHITEREGSFGYAIIPPSKPEAPKNQNPILVRAFKAAEQSIEKNFGRKPLYLREGGSVHIIEQFKTVLGIDSLMIGLALPEDNFHAPNESFNLNMMKQGIPASMEILKGIAGI